MEVLINKILNDLMYATHSEMHFYICKSFILCKLKKKKLNVTSASHFCRLSNIEEAVAPEKYMHYRIMASLF